MITFSAIAVVAGLFDREFAIEDTPVFEAASQLAQYSDERLQAATEGRALPEPPTFAGDVVTARIAYVLGGLNAALMMAASLIAMGPWRERAAQVLRLGGYAFERVWKPALVTIGGYVLVIAYSVIVTALDLDWIEPSQAVPGTIARDNWGLLIFGLVAVIGAPLSEELFFRGIVFGGFARFGFLPAAFISGLAFSLAHIDPGTLIPFTIIGMGFAWLFWSSGSLWDSIIAHLLFNLTSFLLLLSRA